MADIEMKAPDHQKMIDVDDDVQVSPGCGWYCLHCPCRVVFCPCWLAGSVLTIQENEQVIKTFNGKYAGRIDESGLAFLDMCLYQTKRFDVKIKSYNLPTSKMVDRSGSPLLVSGMLTYQIVDGFKANFAVQDYNSFVVNNAGAALKACVSKYNYEDDDPDTPDLKTEGAVIGKDLVAALQERVSVAGIKIHSFVFDELSYAPEIAAGMLKSQQAAALIKARKLIVAGAVQTATESIGSLESQGVTMSAEGRERLVINMLTVMVSDSDATPTVSV